MPHRLKHRLEYVALRAVVALACLLPLRAALALVWPLARLGHALARRRVHEARRRLRAVLGPGVSEADLRRWAWLSWRNLFFNAIEIARAPRWNRAAADRYFDHRDVQRLLDYQRTHGGYTLAVCHMGNWELAGFTSRLLGLPIFVMMRSQSNPLTTAYLDRMREAADVAALERHSKALGQIARRIRNGEVFTILPDIRSKTLENSVVVPFLGGDAHLNAGAVLFAKHTNTPVLTALVTRTGWTRHRIEVQDPILPDPALGKDEDIRRITALVMARFDTAIRRDPGQYFWYNKRWVLDPDFG
jgi:KDO2-lipid IV(A) lauroyltransferase